jgi:hypothetical protein
VAVLYGGSSVSGPDRAHVVGVPDSHVLRDRYGLMSVSLSGPAISDGHGDNRDVPHRDVSGLGDLDSVPVGPDLDEPGQSRPGIALGRIPHVLSILNGTAGVQDGTDGLR